MADVAVHRVVIVGGGFGGLFAAKFLRRAPVEVTLVDARNYHLFQPLLYQLATGILSAGEVAPPIRDVLRRHANVTVEMATVEEFDLDASTVTARRPDETVRTYEYDSLIVAAGAAQSYFGHDEFSRFAPGMKTIDDALELRGRIFGAFEMAENEEDPEARSAWLTFVVVGGGPTGVEIAGQIAELSRTGLKRNFRRIDPAEPEVLLVDGGKEILATFGDRLSEKAAKRAAPARRDDPDRFDRHGRRRLRGRRAGRGRVDRADRRPGRRSGLPACRRRRWPGLLAQASGASCDRPGRIGVLEDCTLPGHPEVFVIGDMMALDDLPGVAEVAMQSGIHAANTIKRRLRGEEAASFTYRDLGSMATISRFHAVVSFKKLRLSGFLGWLMWLFVHITFLTGFKNRLSAMFHWTGTFAAGGRAERTITLRQTVGRVALERSGGGDLRNVVPAVEQHDDAVTVTARRPAVTRARRTRGDSLIDVVTGVALAIDPVPWARSQMAFTLAFHIILVPLGVSWSVMTLIANYRGIKHGDKDAMLLAQRWSKYMAVTFAVGAVTGPQMSLFNKTLDRQRRRTDHVALVIRSSLRVQERADGARSGWPQRTPSASFECVRRRQWITRHVEIGRGGPPFRELGVGNPAKTQATSWRESNPGPWPGSNIPPPDPPRPRPPDARQGPLPHRARLQRRRIPAPCRGESSPLSWRRSGGRHAGTCEAAMPPCGSPMPRSHVGTAHRHHVVRWRFTLRRSWRMRSTPAHATTSAPAAAAMSRVAASGARPFHPKNATSTFCVFCRMKTANSSNNSDSTMTAIQVPLVRDPRSGSCPVVGSSTPLVAASLCDVASLASGSEGWAVLTVTPWSRATRTRSTQIVCPRSHVCRHQPAAHPEVTSFRRL